MRYGISPRKCREFRFTVWQSSKGYFELTWVPCWRVPTDRTVLRIREYIQFDLWILSFKLLICREPVLSVTPTKIEKIIACQDVLSPIAKLTSFNFIHFDMLRHTLKWIRILHYWRCKDTIYLLWTRYSSFFQILSYMELKVQYSRQCSNFQNLLSSLFVQGLVFLQVLHLLKMVAWPKIVSCFMKQTPCPKYLPMNHI